MLGSPPAGTSACKETPAVKIRPLIILISLLTAGLLVGCGGGGKGQSVDESTSGDQLLKQTFSGEKKVDSGRLDLTLAIDVTGGSNSQLQGPISLKLSGPFQTQGKGQLPKFDIDASFEGAGQSIKGGLASTGDKGFVKFNGTEYAVSDQIYQQFKAGYEQAQKQASSQGGNQQSLATLGIDPRRWLKDPQNAGEAKVGDTDTIKITGGVDVGRLLDDVNAALGKASALGLGGAGKIPQKLTDAQRREVVESVRDPRVEIYTGAEDKVLRRMVVNLGVDD